LANAKLIAKVFAASVPTLGSFGNIEIEFAAAINILTNLYVPTDYTFVENHWGYSFYKIYQ